MKTVSLAFVGLLIFVHATDDFAVALATPLSMFRDGPQATAGYLLFGLLLAAGIVLLQLLVRLHWWLDVAVLLATFGMLAYVARSPSVGLEHNVVALVLMFQVYVYYAFLFYRCESRWFWVHLFVPATIALATRMHSYGLWQKSLILYFLLAMNLQYHTFSQWRRKRQSDGEPPAPPRPPRDTERRQQVYTLDD